MKNANPTFIIFFIILIIALLPYIPAPTLSQAESLVGVSKTHADFNDDGYRDLAIGVPDENVGDIIDAGAVSVLYGNSSGLSYYTNQLWTQDSVSILDDSERNDHFGTSVAIGDFDRDGFSDLGIGVPDEDLFVDNVLINNTGAVDVIWI